MIPLFIFKRLSEVYIMVFVKDDIVNVAEELGFNMEDMSGKTYSEIHSMLLENISELHSIDELKEFAQQLTDKIICEYGFDAYRVYAGYPLIRTKGYHGFDEVHLYKKLHEAMSCSSKAFCKINKINHKIDLAILEHEFSKIYGDKYGFLSKFVGDYEDLIHIMKMVERRDFDPDYIKVIELDIEDALIKAGDKFFHKQDLSNREIITQLYNIVGEVYGLYGYRFDIFHDYDGYGNVVFRL